MERLEKYFENNQVIFHVAGGLLVMAVTLTAYAYTNFVTKTEATETSTYLDKRLERIEKNQDHIGKNIDHILERLPRR